MFISKKKQTEGGSPSLPRVLNVFSHSSRLHLSTEGMFNPHRSGGGFILLTSLPLALANEGGEQERFPTRRFFNIPESFIAA